MKSLLLLLLVGSVLACRQTPQPEENNGAPAGTMVFDYNGTRINIPLKNRVPAINPHDTLGAWAGYHTSDRSINIAGSTDSFKVNLSISADSVTAPMEITLLNPRRKMMIEYRPQPTYTTDPFHPGFLKLTKLDLINGLATGTFSCPSLIEVNSGGTSTVSITNGAFTDIPVTVHPN